MAQETYNCNSVIKTCAYAGKISTYHICDYMTKTGHRRGCKPQECTAYKRKERKNAKKKPK